jgi:hypothetical protein
LPAGRDAGRKVMSPLYPSTCVLGAAGGSGTDV